MILIATTKIAAAVPSFELAFGLGAIETERIKRRYLMKKPILR
jgi:hypothetical protein